MRLRGKGVWYHVLIALTAVACANDDAFDAAASEPTDAAGQAIVNGKELSSADARSRGILSLRTFFGRKGGPTALNPTGLSASFEQCTATVVGPSWLLTARHCIWPQNGGSLPVDAPRVYEPPRGASFYRVGARLQLDAGLPTPAWSYTCDIALVNSTLNDRRRPSLPIFPPGPRRDAEEEREKLARRGPRIPSAQRLRGIPPKDVCRVWLSAGEADVALISLPATGRYPEPTAGVALFDRNVHGLLGSGKEVDVDVFGYSPEGSGTAALRQGAMRLLAPGVKSDMGPGTAMRPGYAHLDPSPGTVPGPQFAGSGDSGGPTLLRGVAGARARFRPA